MEKLTTTHTQECSQIPMSDEERLARLIERDNEIEGDLNVHDGHDCPICKNRGYVFVADKGKETTVACECMPIRQSIRRAKNSGMGRLLEKYSLANFVVKASWQENMLRVAKDYVKSPEGWLYVSGQVGSGKTHLCTGVVAELLKTTPCSYVLWREEASKLKAVVNDVQQRMLLIEPLKTAECLYIDDFFRGNITEGDKNLAYDIINARYNADLATIISSEKTLEELMRIDEAIASRIVQKSAGHVIQIGLGNDRNQRVLQ